jgi:hypothetical protein
LKKNGDAEKSFVIKSPKKHHQKTTAVETKSELANMNVSVLQSSNVTTDAQKRLAEEHRRKEQREVLKRQAEELLRTSTITCIVFL